MGGICRCKTCMAYKPLEIDFSDFTYEAWMKKKEEKNLIKRIIAWLKDERGGAIQL